MKTKVETNEDTERAPTGASDQERVKWHGCTGNLPVRHHWAALASGKEKANGWSKVGASGNGSKGPEAADRQKNPGVLRNGILVS